MSTKSTPGDGVHNCGVKGGYVGWSFDEHEGDARGRTIARVIANALRQVRRGLHA